MSEYKQIKGLLHFIEKMASDNPDLKYRIMCSAHESPDTPDVFTDVQGAESWLDDNRNNDIRVWFAFEGLRLARESDVFQEPPGQEDTGSAQARSRVEMLRALAESTPYEEEAITAMRMIYRLEKKLGKPDR
jgi:hypothetical protein